MAKKFLYFIVICACILGFVGGVGYALYCRAYPIAVGVAVLGVVAWSNIKDLSAKMME